MFVVTIVADIDTDGLKEYTEIFTCGTNPFSSDSDNDGPHDKWIDYGFDPTSSYDATRDPDYDELTNLQEYRLGTIPKEGTLCYLKDLFAEIDYTPGYGPSTTVIDYFVSYYRELNIVNVAIDDEISAELHPTETGDYDAMAFLTLWLGLTKHQSKTTF